MLNTKLTAAASNLALQAHGGEIDRTGEPALDHFRSVADAMETEDETCVALLSDALGTGKVTVEDLRTAGMPDAVVEALECLKRDRSEEFFDYIERIKSNVLAARVKRADLVQRVSDMDRYVSLTGYDRRRRTSCQKAIDIIDGVDKVEYDGLFASQHRHGQKLTPVPPAPQPPANR